MPDTVEVEVLAIDGAPPQPVPPVSPPPRGGGVWGAGLPTWRSLGARLMRLDRRWWPLWVLLGGVVLAAAVAVALCVAAFFAALAITRGVFRLLAGPPSPPAAGSLRRSGWS